MTTTHENKGQSTSDIVLVILKKYNTLFTDTSKSILLIIGITFSVFLGPDAHLQVFECPVAMWSMISGHLSSQHRGSQALQTANKCNRLFDLTDFGYSYWQLVVGTDPSQGIYRGNQKPRCSFSTLHSLMFQHHNYWLLIVHLEFTTANSVHLTTTDHLLSLSDTDTISEHLPTADIANREPIHM